MQKWLHFVLNADHAETPSRLLFTVLGKTELRTLVFLVYSELPQHRSTLHSSFRPTCGESYMRLSPHSGLAICSNFCPPGYFFLKFFLEEFMLYPSLLTVGLLILCVRCQSQRNTLGTAFELPICDRINIEQACWNGVGREKNVSSFSTNFCNP